MSCKSFVDEVNEAGTTIKLYTTDDSEMKIGGKMPPRETYPWYNEAASSHCHITRASAPAGKRPAPATRFMNFLSFLRDQNLQPMAQQKLEVKKKKKKLSQTQTQTRREMEASRIKRPACLLEKTQNMR